MRRNFLELGRPEDARRAITIAGTGSILLFGGLALVPDSILESVPDSIIPVIYSTVVTWIAKDTQGVQVERHERNGGKLRSAWVAFGIGLLSLVMACITFSAVYTLKP